MTMFVFLTFNVLSVGALTSATINAATTILPPTGVPHPYLSAAPLTQVLASVNNVLR